MGWKYEVSVWDRPADKWEVGNHFRFYPYYGTQWLVVAVYQLWKAKRKSKCAKLEWKSE